MTADEIADPHALDIELTVNGELRQQGSTRDMIFRIPELIAYVSAIMTLEPGDIISTGTPAGAGIGQRNRFARATKSFARSNGSEHAQRREAAIENNRLGRCRLYFLFMLVVGLYFHAPGQPQRGRLLRFRPRPAVVGHRALGGRHLHRCGTGAGRDDADLSGRPARQRRLVDSVCRLDAARRCALVEVLAPARDGHLGGAARQSATAADSRTFYRGVYAVFMSFGFIVVLMGYVSGWLGAALGPDPRMGTAQADSVRRRSSPPSTP